MVFKHFVFSGGYHIFICILGSLQRMEEDNVINITDIETTWCVSSGSFAAITISLLKGYRLRQNNNNEQDEFNWDILKNYLLERPWNYLFNIPTFNLYDFFSKNGIYDESLTLHMLEPLLKLLDLPIDITMKEFYDYSKVECHFFSFDVYTFQFIDISHKTFPDMLLRNVMYVTSSVPFLSKPHIEYGKCFLDGGAMFNYPINYCIKRITDPTEILGYNTELITVTDIESPDFENMSIFHYVYSIGALLYNKIYKFFICREENTRCEGVYQDIEKYNTDNDTSHRDYYSEVSIVSECHEEIQLPYKTYLSMFQELYDFIMNYEKRKLLWDFGNSKILINKKCFYYINK
jgi:hypothetical protein